MQERDLVSVFGNFSVKTSLICQHPSEKILAVGKFLKMNLYSTFMILKYNVNTAGTQFLHIKLMYYIR